MEGLERNQTDRKFIGLAAAYAQWSYRKGFRGVSKDFRTASHTFHRNRVHEVLDRNDVARKGEMR